MYCLWRGRIRKRGRWGGGEAGTEARGESGVERGGPGGFVGVDVYMGRSAGGELEGSRGLKTIPTTADASQVSRSTAALGEELELEWETGE